MRYSERIAFTITAGVPQGNVFRGNSVYDPNFTGVGAKAYGYNQIATYYDEYTVVNSTCRVVLMPQTGTNLATQSLIFGLQASASSSLFLSDIGMWTETGDGCYALTNSSGYGGFGGGAQPTLRMKRSSAKMLGFTPIQANTDRELSSSIGSNPNLGWYWKIYCNSADGATTTSALADVSITYHTAWRRRTGSIASS